MTLTTHAYGRHPDQFGELSVPDGDRRAGVVVVIHGGFWRAGHGLENGRALAADLVTRGWTAWNIEYRRVGDGGGWPETLQDVSDAIEFLATLEVDTSRVVTVGHSAGGHLAVWSAGRSGLAPDAPGASPRVAVTAAISQGGVLDLATAAETGVGGTVVQDLLGGEPDEVASRYAAADPVAAVPLSVPVVAIHTRLDDVVPFHQSERYVAVARAFDADATLVEVPGDHDSHIDPTTDAWGAVISALESWSTSSADGR